VKRKPRKYQAKLTIYPMTFEQAIDTVLKYKMPEKKKKKSEKR